MLSTDDVFAQVVTDGLHRRRRRRRRRAWVAAPAVIALFAALLLWPAGNRPARTVVSVAAPPPSLPPTTLVIPKPPGGHEVRVPAPLLPMPAEAPVLADIPPDLALVQRLADALGIGGTATSTADGFTVVGGRTSLSVTPSNGIRTWLIRMDPCPPGQCRPPDVRPAVPAPTVETRDAPDHPPFEAAPVAADAARRIATVLGGVTVTHLQMALGEWWAPMQFVDGGDPVVPSGFTAHIQPDGSVRYASGGLDRAGPPGPPRKLVGIDEALRRLAAPPEISDLVGRNCPDVGVYVVTGVRLAYQFTGPDGFAPVYAFSVTECGEASERWIAAL